MTIADEIAALPEFPHDDEGWEGLPDNVRLGAVILERQCLSARLALADRLLRGTLGVTEFIFVCFPALTGVLTEAQMESISRDLQDVRAYLERREAE